MAPRVSCSVLFREFDLRVPQIVCALALSIIPQLQFGQPLPPRWRSTVELTIGGSNADEHSEFGRLTGIAADASGRIFIADAGDNNIRVFAPDGKFVSTIGRKGAGPLEFGRLAGMAFGPERLLWTRDEGNGRFLALDVAAAPARVAKQVPLLNFTSGNHTAIVFDPEGMMVDEGSFYDKAADTFRPIRIRRSPAGVTVQSDTLPPVALSATEKQRADSNGQGRPRKYCSTEIPLKV